MEAPKTTKKPTFTHDKSMIAPKTGKSFASNRSPKNSNGGYSDLISDGGMDPRNRPGSTEDRERQRLAKQRSGRRSARQPNGPTYCELQEQVRDLERRTDPLQSTQEIKYLRRQVETMRTANKNADLAVLNLEVALVKLNVPRSAIDKMKTNQPVKHYDVTPEFVVLVSPEEGEE